ncbi:MAG: DMT family transporter [Rhodospirillales bacterium]|nr:MAG: DMT family transporter [Rhodospirillales bacterium]
MARETMQSDSRTRQLRLGAGLMVVAMTVLGLFPTGARIAYAGGSTPETVAVARHLFTLFFVIALMPTEDGGRRFALALPRRMWPAAIGLGALLAVYSWAYISAIAYIPVSLAVLLLYTFPAQVVLMTALAGTERATPVRVLALAVAFSGVALAVGVNAAEPDPRGVALGLLAAFGLALVTVLVARLSGMRDRRATTANFALIAAILTAAAVSAGPGFAAPQTATAWTGLIFAGAAAGLGVTLFFIALPLLGPVRTALLSNLEPVVATLGAVAVLGEQPGIGQFAGIVLVICAIVLIQRTDRQ